MDTHATDASSSHGKAGIDDAPEMKQPLRALHDMRAGEFSVRLPAEWTGVMGKVSDRFNDIARANGYSINPWRRRTPNWPTPTRRCERRSRANSKR